jgi:hypothetical protein
LAGEDELKAQILYWETKEIGDQAYGFQIQTHVPGKPIDSYPNPEQSRAIVNAVYEIQGRLCGASKSVGTDSVPDIHDVIIGLYDLVS